MKILQNYTWLRFNAQFIRFGKGSSGETFMFGGQEVMIHLGHIPYWKTLMTLWTFLEKLKICIEQNYITSVKIILLNEE